MNDATKEFNALASLIGESAQNVEKDNFKLNLFPQQPSAKKGDPTFEDDQNVINIDLSANSQKKASDIAKDLGKVEIDDEALDGDDMLAMMDDNSD